MSNRLDSDQAQHYVGPDLGPSCLQKLLAVDSSKQRVHVGIAVDSSKQRVHVGMFFGKMNSIMIQ